MLTVDFERLGVGPGTRVLDLGCGQGRHAFEALRRGAAVVAADIDDKALADVAQMAAAMIAAGEVPATGRLATRHADALALPFEDAFRRGHRQRDPGAHPRGHRGDGGDDPASCARVVRSR